MLTLYGTRGSGAAAVEAALARAGLAYTPVDAASWQPGAGLDELLRVNPLGQIPTLRLADGTVLTESAAILIHLGLTASPGLLLPAGASDRARAIRGLVYIATNCYAAIGVIGACSRHGSGSRRPSARGQSRRSAPPALICGPAVQRRVAPGGWPSLRVEARKSARGVAHPRRVPNPAPVCALLAGFLASTQPAAMA